MSLIQAFNIFDLGLELTQVSSISSLQLTYLALVQAFQLNKHTKNYLFILFMHFSFLA